MTISDIDKFFETWGFVLAADISTYGGDTSRFLVDGRPLQRTDVWYPELGVSIAAYVPVGWATPDRRIIFAWLGRAALEPEMRAAMEPRG
jgi:hypothetical protein